MDDPDKFIADFKEMLSSMENKIVELNHEMKEKAYEITLFSKKVEELEENNKNLESTIVEQNTKIEEYKKKGSTSTNVSQPKKKSRSLPNHLLTTDFIKMYTKRLKAGTKFFKDPDFEVMNVQEFISSRILNEKFNSFVENYCGLLANPTRRPSLNGMFRNKHFFGIFKNSKDDIMFTQIKSEDENYGWTLTFSQNKLYPWQDLRHASSTQESDGSDSKQDKFSKESSISEQKSFFVDYRDKRMFKIKLEFSTGPNTLYYVTGEYNEVTEEGLLTYQKYKYQIKKGSLNALGLKDGAPIKYKFVEGNSIRASKSGK